MSREADAEDHLVKHYSNLEDLNSDFRNYNLFNLVAGFVRGEDVIDIGCGAAYLLNILKKRGKKVLGVEPSEGMIEIARKTNPEIKIIAGHAEEIDQIIKGSVDTVLMMDVLEHIENDGQQVKKVNSVLKKDGEFIFVVPAHQFLYGKRDEAMGHYRRYSKKMLREILAANGFQIELIRHWNVLGFLPYFISEKIFQKPLQSKLRKSSEKGLLSRFARNFLHLWFRRIENNFDFGCGLSIIVIARKI